MTEGRPLVVVYDGECALCLRFVALLRRWDREGALELLPYQSAGERFPWIPRSAFEAEIQVVEGEGERWSGAEGVERILRRLPPSRPLSYLFYIPLVRRAAGWLYGLVARNRRRLGCAEHCGVGANNHGRTNGE